MKWALVLIASWAVACGGTTMGATDASADQAAPTAADASSPDVLSDAAGFSCGDATCDPSQVCLYPPYGCVQLSLTDAGTCPAGTDYQDATNGCLPPPPQPSCITIDASAGQIDCSGVDAAPGCDFVSAPIPITCSRICRGICV